jgi:hypothetical protein
LVEEEGRKALSVPCKKPFQLLCQLFSVVEDSILSTNLLGSRPKKSRATSFYSRMYFATLAFNTLLSLGTLFLV